MFCCIVANFPKVEQIKYHFFLLLLTLLPQSLNTAM